MNNLFSFHLQRYFMTYLIKQHNYGQNTISSYRDTFRLLLMFITESRSKISALKIDEISCDLIDNFMLWLETERKNCVSTKNVRLAHLKSFFRYLMISSPEYADQCSKVLNIPFGKTEKKPPACLSTEATKSLLAVVNSKTEDGLRHLAIMSLLYDSGCRVQELIDLNVSDFSPGQCSRIYVHGKGNKYRSIPLLGETEKILSKYVKHFKLSADSPLFSNKRGERLTRQGIRHILSKYTELAKMQKPNVIVGSVYPHLLRHSKASHLVDGGINIYNVRDFLGHESVTTTQVYLTSNPDVTRKVIESAAAQIVPESIQHFSATERDDLMAFLDSLG